MDGSFTEASVEDLGIVVACDVLEMRSGISIAVTAGLEAVVAARGSLQKHAWRARIFPLTDNGQVEDLCVALAGALHGRGHSWVAA